MDEVRQAEDGPGAGRSLPPGGGGSLPDGAPVAVVGGGLAGLAAAAVLARAGAPVQVFERTDAPGGRARTSEHRGFLLNLGPHALYRAGAGAPVLRALGIRPRGGRPRPEGSGVPGLVLAGDWVGAAGLLADASLASGAAAARALLGRAA